LHAFVPRPSVERLLTPFLLLNVAVLLAVYAWLLLPILRDGGYMPAWTDEYGYVLDARSFAENGTLHAARLKEERVAKVLGAGTHGASYILLQGALARAFGDPVALSLWPNLVVLAIALLLVLVQPLRLAERLTVVVLLLLHFAVFLYAFTWMVETWQVLFAVAASLLLATLYRAERGSARFRRALVLYVALLLVLATFRVSYGLWALGLVPLARDRGELLGYGLLAIVVLAAGMGAMQLLSAPNPHWPLSRAAAALGRGDVAASLTLLAGNVGVNLQRYFVSETQGLAFYLVMKYLTVVVGAVLLAGAWLRRDRLALAACLILGAHLALLLVLYDAHTWREHRHLAPVFYLLVVALVAGGYRIATAALYVVLLVLFPEVVGYVNARIIPERTLVAAQWAEATEARASLARLGDLQGGSGDGPITVLHAQGFYRNLSIFPLALPVRSRDGRPLRYTGNLGMTPDAKRFGRIAVDYVLLPPEAPPVPGGVQVHADPFYVLYDLRSASGAATGGSGSPRSSAGDSRTRFLSSPSSSSSAARRVS
jgi:hypothetical protein